MRTELEPTGERMIEGAYATSRGAYAIYAMHLASYDFASTYCAGMRVLDLGCGSGYGCKRISSVASRVVGVDVSDEAIAFALRTYGGDNVSFTSIVPDGSLPFDDGEFDVVLSFQVIEHVPDAERYLREARRVLAKGGLLIVITPDRTHRLLPFQRPWNRWHVREYSMDQLLGVVPRGFDIERALRMGAPDHVAAIELRRYRLTKWATIPFTLPWTPERLRKASLGLIHALMPKRDAVSAGGPSPRPNFDFDETVFVFSESPPNPLNLVLVARAS